MESCWGRPGRRGRWLSGLARQSSHSVASTSCETDRLFDVALVVALVNIDDSRALANPFPWQQAALTAADHLPSVRLTRNGSDLDAATTHNRSHRHDSTKL